MKTNKKRKEVVLNNNIIAILEEQAKSQGRNLMNYMEYIFVESSNNILK